MHQSEALRSLTENRRDFDWLQHLVPSGRIPMNDGSCLRVPAAGRRYSAATANGGACKRSSSSFRLASAICRFTSFTGPKPRI